MATQPTEEVIEWHKRLGGDSFDYWIPATVTSCFTEEKLKALSDIHSSGNFSNLSECLKAKLLLALCNMPQRNSDQWRQHIDAIFNVALSEGSDSWVRPIADMLYTLPSLGYLRTGLEDNPLVSDALSTVQTKRPWRLSSLPMEAEFVNSDVLADLGCPDIQQQQQQRHFVIVRKPRSVVAMGVILEKAARQRDDAGGGGGGRRYTAPIKMRSFAKNWYDEDETDAPASESAASGRRPPPSSLSGAGHRLPGSQMRRAAQLTGTQSQPPLQLLARQRSINPPATPGGSVHHHLTHPQQQQQQQQQQQHRTTMLIEMSEPPAIGRAAKARRRQEETERRRQEERAAKEEAAARAAQEREAEEARQVALAKEAEEAAAAAAEAAAVAAASAAAAATAASALPPSSTVDVISVSMPARPTAASFPSAAIGGAGLPHLLTPMAAASQALDGGLATPSVVPATLPSLRLTPASAQQHQQAGGGGGRAAEAAPTPSYLLPFAPAYAGQMQQPTLFAYGQPTASAAPNNITVVQLVNRPYPVQQQLQQQQPQQQFQHQHQLQHQPLTPEQSRAAAELFATANKLTKPEKSLIVAFIGGNRTNLTPELGHLVRIHLSEYKERVFDQNQRVYKDVVADQYFQMDYSNGHWTIVKRYKEGAPEVLARLDYLRPQQQQQ